MSEPVTLPADLFSPRSIAVLGASGEPGKLAHRPLDYLRRLGYGGAVYPINPGRAEILGWPCYADLAEVPGPIDAALVSVAAAAVPAALRACAERGIRLAVVLTSGLPADLPLPPGLFVMGPNSMGFLDAHRRVPGSWSSSLDLPTIRAGRVGFISQSGALGGSVVNRFQDRGVGLSYAFWSGNEFQLDTCHLLQFLLDDPGTTVVALLIEGLRRPRRFLELAALALERRKPLVVCKLGHVPAANEIAVAHTGMLVGSASAYRAAFRQYGVSEVGSLDELVETTALFARTPLPTGDGLGVISSSGGVAVLVTDLCQQLGLRLPPLAAETQADLAAMLPPFASAPTNPLDVTAGLQDDALFGPLARLAEDPAIDLVLHVVTVLGGAERLRQRGAGLVAASERIAKPLVSCWTAGSLADQGIALLAEADLPYSTAPDLCLRGVKALFDYCARLDRRAPPAPPPDLERARPRVREALLAAHRAGDRVLGERESAPLLAAYGLPLVESRFAATADEAVAAAEALDYPVVLKVDAAGLAHKARVGGVRVGVARPAEVAEAFHTVVADVRRADPSLAVRGVLVQPQAPAGLEAVLGVAQDSQFGPQVLLGLGGTYAEVLAQVAVRLAPLRPADAEELVDETPLRAAPSRAALVDALVRLSWFAHDLADLVAECDLNPVRLYPDGLLALDALVVLSPSPANWPSSPGGRI